MYNKGERHARLLVFSICSGARSFFLAWTRRRESLVFLGWLASELHSLDTSR